MDSGLTIWAAEAGRTRWEFARDGGQIFVAGFLVMVLVVAWIYRRDTKQLPLFWKFWLFGLRTAVVLALLIVALDPVERVETKTVLPSRAVVLVDTSQSMVHPAENPKSDRPDEARRTRAEAIEELLSKSPLIGTLSQTHDLKIMSFDSRLEERGVIPRKGSGVTLSEEPKYPNIPGTSVPIPSFWPVVGLGIGLTALLGLTGIVLAWRGVGPSTALIVMACVLGAGTAVCGSSIDAALQEYDRDMDAWLAQKTPSDPAESKPIDWKEITKPKGLETRLGDSVKQAVKDSKGETLSGIVIISEGQQNAGIDAESASRYALAEKVRLITVGVGSTEPQVNLVVSNVQAPTHVHKGDGFSILAYVQAQGMGARNINVELLSKKEEDSSPPAVIETREVQLIEDGTPVVVKFDYIPQEAGRLIFNVRATPVGPSRELTLDDNQWSLPPVEVIERKLKVLIVAGGPMRDYQFVRNLFFRDATLEMDLWLQTGDEGVSQESANILFRFPAEREEFFKYDALFAFDPDWDQVPKEIHAMIEEWVSKQAGGLVYVAGDVHTTQLANDPSEFLPLINLLPVYLDENDFRLRFDREEESSQPWPIEFTREGYEAGSLQLADNAGDSKAIWDQFEGIYRTYPTNGEKPGATIYAHFGDVRAATNEKGKPIVLASQFYGSGRVLFLGSPEMWRIRKLEEIHFEKLWINLLREVGQGRMSRGSSRGILLPERDTYTLGNTVQIQANILDPQYKEFVTDSVTLDIFDPTGRQVLPSVKLPADPNRPGKYRGSFTANMPGRYRLEMPVPPDGNERAVRYVQVKVPSLEYDRTEQNISLLKQLATTELGGDYVPISEAATLVPKLLPDRTTTKSTFDTPRELWDKRWVMYLLVGLLSVEWLTRKLLRLA